MPDRSVGRGAGAQLTARPRRPADPSARALAEALRGELAAIDPPRTCDRRAERAGLGDAARGAAPDAAVARSAVRLERAGGGSEAFDWDAAAEHCRIAWMRGRFLARGSLSLAGGRTHLEFVVPVDEAPELTRRTAELGLGAAWRVRRGTGVVTWKSAETVVRFFRLAGASEALLELEARLVGRSLKAGLNRVANAENANLERVVVASARQVRAIAALAAAGRLAGQGPIARSVAAARTEAPEASLSDLALATDLPRATVQHTLERIVALAEGRQPRAARPGSLARPGPGAAADPKAAAAAP